MVLIDYKVKNVISSSAAATLLHSSERNTDSETQSSRIQNPCRFHIKLGEYSEIQMISVCRLQIKID